MIWCAISRALHVAGHAHHAAAVDHAPAGAADPFDSPNIQVRHVPYLTFPLANRRGTTILDRSTAYLLFGVRAGRLARRLARAGEADIVHGFGASVLGYALGGRGGSPAPLVFNPQGLEEFGATGRRGCRGASAPATPRSAARSGDARAPRTRSSRPTLRWSRRHPSSRGPAVISIWTIPNGIDLLEAAAFAGPAEGAIIRQRHGIGTGETVLLSVGRLEENKGFDVLAAALGGAARPGSPLSATGWRWVIVGAGPFRPTIEQAVDDTRPPRPRALRRPRARCGSARLVRGGVASSSIPPATKAVRSSRSRPWRIAVPVIATRAGGLPDKVRPGRNGWLVEPDDAIGLGRAIVDATSTPGQLAAMGAHSRAIVEAEFAWPVIAERHLEMYKELRQGRRQNAEVRTHK